MWKNTVFPEFVTLFQMIYCETGGSLGALPRSAGPVPAVFLRHTARASCIWTLCCAGSCRCFYHSEGAEVWKLMQQHSLSLGSESRAGCFQNPSLLYSYFNYYLSVWFCTDCLLSGVIFKSYFYLCVSVFLCKWVSCECRFPWRPEEGVSSPGARVTGNHEVPDVGAGN